MAAGVPSSSSSSSSTTAPASRNVPVVADKQSEVILPARTALNPVPALPAALRIDNRDQLTALLEASSSGKQALVFANGNLRTLLLRQVLSDPNSRIFKGKKNWDKIDSFPLPRQLRIASTHVLDNLSATMGSGGAASAFASTNPFAEDDNDDGFGGNNNNNSNNESSIGTDVSYVTFFLNPSNLPHTMKTAQRIKQWSNPSVHYRIVYLPNASALCTKVLQNAAITTAPNVSIHGLQLDLFPLETDVLSMEYADAFKETHVEGTPSPVVTTVARTLLKIQDVVGLSPRIQGMGPLAEDVIERFVATRLEEHTADPENTTGLVDGSESDVTAMMVIDRKIDMVTPMMTPLTYEGLLDDVVGIDCGCVHQKRVIGWRLLVCLVYGM